MPFGAYCRGVEWRHEREENGSCSHHFTITLYFHRTAKIGGGAKQLSERQRKSLYSSQVLEFKRRYGKKLGDRRAEMILCENNNRELMGVAAVEVEKIPEKSLTSLSKKRAPLMSNVAVSKKWRRRGIAEILVKEIERMVQLEWGYDDIYTCM